MNKNLLQINVSNPKYKTEEDLIKIKFKNEDHQINFTKFFIQSKYLRDKYKYFEGLTSIQSELDELMNELNIKEDSIKNFIELLDEEKVNIPIECYKDIYTLSEYFQISKFITVLDDINHDKLFKDLNFTIEILYEKEKSTDKFDEKMKTKIENFFKTRINECLQNPKFGELPIPTICRILEGNQTKFDHNLLIDFIFDSIETRFIIFQFIEIDKLTDDKLKEFIKLIEEQEETSKKIYLEYIPFNLSFIKNIINKYEQLYKDMKQTKQELNETKQELNQTKHQLDETKHELSQTKQELNLTKHRLDETKQELNRAKQELNETKQELNETKQELNLTKHRLDETKQELNETKQELNLTKHRLDETKQEFNQTKQEQGQYKKELKQYKDEFNQVRSEKKEYTQSIIVGGYDNYNGLGEKPNDKGIYGDSIIYPPVKLLFDPSSILSYSIYDYHSVFVTDDGSLKGVGDNKVNSSISATLQKAKIDDFTDFCIKDGSGCQLTAVSAVCSNSGTLYMFSRSSGNERQLVLCDHYINGGNPVFLDIDNHHPVSLFGGFSHSAFIGSEGEVIFINRNSVKNSPNSPIAAVSLPDGEKASSVACCVDSVVVLSSNGRVFSSPIESNRVLNFSPVSELSNHEIVCVSGTSNHFLAVSKEGRVFGRGSNNCGQLGLGEGRGSVSSFTEISSLVGYKIKAAYAGNMHSLFETLEGKILSCGSNKCGELLLSSGPSKNIYYSPTETTITSGAAFCIAGNELSVIFIGKNPPPNTPNVRIQQYE